MNIFTPVNKHLLIEKIDLDSKKEGLVELPEDYVKKNLNRYIPVKFLSHSADCDILYENFFGSSIKVILVVDQTMIEEVIIEDINYSLVHQNNVIGVMENTYEIK